METDAPGRWDCKRGGQEERKKVQGRKTRKGDEQMRKEMKKKAR